MKDFNKRGGIAQMSEDQFCQVLNAELTNDPLGRGYAAMSDNDAATSLMTVNRPGYVPIKDVDIFLSTYFLRYPLSLLYNDPNTAADLKAVLYECLNIRDALFGFISQEMHAQMVTLFGSLPFITPTMLEVWQTLDDNRQCRAEELGLIAVSSQQVALCRQAEGGELP